MTVMFQKVAILILWTTQQTIVLPIKNKNGVRLLVTMVLIGHIVLLTPEDVLLKITL